MSEHLNTEDKTESITFKVTPTMKKEIEDLMEKKRWRMSAFIRVAIRESLKRIKYD